MEGESQKKLDGYLDVISRMKPGHVRVAHHTGVVESGAFNICAEHFLMILCLSGSAYYMIRNKSVEESVELKESDILLIPPGSWVGVTPRKPYLTLGVSFGNQIVHAYLVRPWKGAQPPGDMRHMQFERPCHGISGTEQPAVLDSRLPVTAEIQALLRALVTGAGRSFKDPYLLGLGELLLSETAAFLDCEGPATESKAHATFLAAQAEVSRSWNRGINRNTVADTLNIHPQHLTRLFHRYAGKSFNEYLADLRLDRALTLLERGDVTVTQTAAACGFGSVEYFVRCFTRKIGHTPGKHVFRHSQAGRKPT